MLPREEQSEHCQTCCSCERGAGRVCPVSSSQSSCPDLLPSCNKRLPQFFKPAHIVWVMQKPSCRPVWLHQHLHPTLCGSPKPGLYLLCQGSVPCSSLPLLMAIASQDPWPPQILRPGRTVRHIGLGQGCLSVSASLCSLCPAGASEDT